MIALVIETAEAPTGMAGHQTTARPTNRQNVVRLGEQIVFARGEGVTAVSSGEEPGQRIERTQA